jgi:hypothetical protein
MEEERWVEGLRGLSLSNTSELLLLLLKEEML